MNHLVNFDERNYELCSILGYNLLQKSMDEEKEKKIAYIYQRDAEI